MNLIRFNVDDELRDAFKLYCIQNSTTMSKVLIDYITTLVNKEEKDTRKRIAALLKTVNEEDLPGEEKNSVKNIAVIKLYHCPYCGKDITRLIPPDRLKHLQNCKNGQKE